MDNNYKEDLRKFKLRWRPIHGPYKPSDGTYEYLNIGNNVEFEYYTFNLIHDGGVNASIILRNQNQITESSLADMLKTIREYIISETDKLQLSSGTMEFFKLVCEEFDLLHFQIISVVFDPGFQTQPSIQRDIGLKLASMEIWFNGVFDDNNRIHEFLREKMRLDTLLFDPQVYYDAVMFTKPQVDLFNEKLFGISNRLNQHKKFDIMLKQFLKGGKIGLAVEIPMGDDSVEGKSIEVSWHYEIDENDPPYIRMTVDHSKLYDNHRGSLWGHVHENRKGGHYVIRLTEESYRKLSEVNEPWDQIESYIISSFQHYITYLLDKNHMSFDTNKEQFKVVDH
jgi:hypothetical protein